MQLVNDVQFAHDDGQFWHIPDWWKYFGGQVAKHIELYKEPVRQDKHVVEVFVHVLHGALQYIQVLFRGSTYKPLPHEVTHELLRVKR